PASARSAGSACTSPSWRRPEARAMAGCSLASTSCSAAAAFECGTRTSASSWTSPALIPRLGTASPRWPSPLRRGRLGPRAGGGRAAVVGALLGMLVGVMVAPIGLLVGPMVGAVAAELLTGRAPKASLRSGIGAALGVLTGVVAHFALALVMVGFFVWWVS